jgi:hypothetical protein
MITLNCNDDHMIRQNPGSGPTDVVGPPGWERKAEASIKVAYISSVLLEKQ